MVIPLGRALLPGSSNLPAGSGCPPLAIRALSACGATGRCAAPPGKERLAFLPIWSCSVWGLPCRSHCCERGGLLPHPFTLTSPPLRATWRFAFCCTGRPSALTLRSRTLSGTLPFGVRTFLPRSTPARERRRPSGRLHNSSLPSTGDLCSLPSRMLFPQGICVR